MAEILIEQRGSLVHPVSYRITRASSTSDIISVTRSEGDETAVAYYTDQALAVRQQRAWLQDQIILRDRLVRI